MLNAPDACGLAVVVWALGSTCHRPQHAKKLSVRGPIQRRMGWLRCALAAVPDRIWAVRFPKRGIGDPFPEA